ncbi:MAG: DUF6778 family protein [Pseudomonadota bacterium]
MEKIVKAFSSALKTPTKIALGLVAAAALSACASGPVETTRNAPATLDSGQLVASAAPTSFDVQAVVVTVPRTLKSTEKNRYYPGGDIVWREDPFGDRHAQVEAILQSGLELGAASLTAGTVPVEVHVELTRFHALTQKARATIGGVHDIEFLMSLRDPLTGKAFGPTKLVKADLKAYGGRKAIEAEMRGLTQKVRITNHLAKVLRAEMTTPEGFVAQNLGILGAINEL